MNDGQQKFQAIARAQSAGRDFVRWQVKRQASRWGERVGKLSDDLRSLGDGLRSKGDESAATLSDQIAGYAERVASYLEQSDPDQFLGDLEAVARRAPVAVAIGGATLGFTASRLLKVSATHRYGDDF